MKGVAFSSSIASALTAPFAASRRLWRQADQKGVRATRHEDGNFKKATEIITEVLRLFRKRYLWKRVWAMV